jgi:hypothetical protein
MNLISNSAHESNKYRFAFQLWKSAAHSASAIREWPREQSPVAKKNAKKKKTRAVSIHEFLRASYQHRKITMNHNRQMTLDYLVLYSI